MEIMGWDEAASVISTSEGLIKSVWSTGIPFCYSIRGVILSSNLIIQVSSDVGSNRDTPSEDTKGVGIYKNHHHLQQLNKYT